MVSAPARREQVRYAETRGVSQRRACLLFGTARASLAYQSRMIKRDEHLRKRIRQLALKHRRYGYRRVGALLRREGKSVNEKRVYRLWKVEKLALPRRKPRRRVVRGVPMPSHHGAPNIVWACDFVYDRCANGQVLRCLTLIDEGTRECLAIAVEASQPARRVIATLRQALKDYGRPCFLRTDNGPEFVAEALDRWATEENIGHTYNQPGKPWQNGKNESFNGKFRDECLDGELFANRLEAKTVIAAWRNTYNHERPHSGIDYMTPNEKRLDYMQKESKVKSNGCLPLSVV